MPEIPSAAIPWVDHMTAVLGATLAAWAVALAWVAFGPIRRGERWAFACVVTSLLAWFPLDTLVSWSQGAMVNVAFNVAALVSILPLLALAWRARSSGAA
jgi:hypothetical protein